MQNSIQFKGYLIQKFSLEKNNNIEKSKKDNININCKWYKNKEKGKENLYKVSMIIELYTKLSKIELLLDGFFDISKKVEDEIIKYFLEVSAPAILYPYARSFISNVTAFDTGEAVILPILNFADMKN